MPRQRTLDFRREGLGTLWERLPERWRQEVLAIYAQLITRAAQQPPRAHERHGRNGREDRNDA
jgi:hypothetical protein